MQLRITQFLFWFNFPRKQEYILHLLYIITIILVPVKSSDSLLVMRPTDYQISLFNSCKLFEAYMKSASTNFPLYLDTKPIEFTVIALDVY